jgi:bla regulator protein BlaR1
MTDWLVSTVVATTVLMLIVLALRAPARRLFGSGAAYALWLLPALRMIAPPLPLGLAPALPQPPAFAQWASASLPAPPSMPEAGVGLGTVVLCVWLAGTAIFAFVQVWRYAVFARAHRPAGFAARRWKGVSLTFADVDGPLAGGLFRRFVLLPLDFRQRYDPQQRRLVLRHEIAHHRRGDVLANAVATLVLALHWWNPVAHLAYRMFRIDQELACDASVMAERSPAQRRTYARALAATAGVQLRPACGWSDAAALKARLRQIAQADRRPGRGSVLLAGLAVGLGLLSMMTAAPPERASASDQSAETDVDLSNPPPPAGDSRAREQARRRNLQFVLERARANPALNDEQRARMVADISGELAASRPS